MNIDLPSIDQMNPLAKAVMQRHGVSYGDALEKLGEFRLHLICPEATGGKIQYQAALITAVNCGKRAFLGGITVQLIGNTVCKLPGWIGKTLEAVVTEIGGTLKPTNPGADKAIAIGQTIDGAPSDAVLVADGWRGGFLPPGSLSPFSDEECSPLGGIFAAGLVVARAFMDVSGIDPAALDDAYGVSLWRPDSPWLSKAAAGPALGRLPEKLWILGLGHLGQAYLWTIGLLQLPSGPHLQVFLQDYDRISTGNWSAGLLCEPSGVGMMKTRVCANWVEQRGVQTTLVERAFDESVRVGADEPKVALCGFDSASGRRVLEDAGFDLIVESGLGTSLSHFDRIALHTFPDATKGPKQIWPETAVPDVLDFDRDLFGREPETEECGILLDQLARKPISASFVGVAASAMVIGEVLRGLHGGRRYETLHVHLRSDLSLRATSKEEIYQLRLARNGSYPIEY